ncbi:hypothetical protein PoB_006786900 [Plakobranchus ocellatus]|uniref:Uncharacterized protein n=1 Tax=Plakobranchus ocellatus TaxID=259542 RepID=A0AAV4DAW1_9GAST|nr:hypothetical protein PoB_006786900 [Plakobranchus ocellatus]
MPKDAAAGCWLTAFAARPTKFFCSNLYLTKKTTKKKKARGTNWALITESIVLSYSSYKVGTPADPYFRFLASSYLFGGNPRDVITLPLAFRYAVNATLWNLEVTLLFASP